MAVDVKWNLAEATEISVLSGWDIIRFKRHPKGWMYGIEGAPDVRYVVKSKLPALLEKYEKAGCGVLVAAPKIQKDKVLKLGKETVIISTKKFNWKGVHTILLKLNSIAHTDFKFVVNHINSKGRPVFDRYARESDKDDWVRRPFEWYVDEIEEWLRVSNEFTILNAEGERMNYEQN